MKTRVLFLFVCFAAGFAMFAGEVVVVPLRGEISTAQGLFLRRTLKEAESAKASAVVIDMDTHGGELEAATRMTEALFKTSVPTITFINPNAGSAGALVALATKRIFMAPVSAIGAAAPVTGSGADLPGTMNDKITSYYSHYFRSVAERNGFNPDIAEAFMSKSREVKTGDTVVHPAGSLLTLSAQEASRAVDGKPLLAEGVAGSVAELLAKAGLQGATVRNIGPTGFETLAFWITTLAPLLLLGGIVGAYVEVKTGGFGIAGVFSGICFALFFAGHYIAGLAGWEIAVLFLAGLALVLGELLVHPGTILPGLAGLLLVAGAIIWAMVDRYPSQPLIPTGEMLARPLWNLAITGTLTAVAVTLLSKYLPRTPLFNFIALGAANPAGPSFQPTTVDSPARLAVGAEGVARSTLRPSGNANFGGVIIDVITRGEFVEAGAPVRVLAVEGSRIVVEKMGA